MQKRVKVITAASVVALLIVAGLVVGLLAKHSLDQHQAKVAAASRSASAAAVAAASRTAAAKASAAAAKASAAAAAAAKSIEQTAERTRRKAIVKSLQADVTKNARKDVADGVLDGPIKYTDCTPLGGGSSDILLDKTGEFSCVAVNKITGTTESGYQFSAVVNWSAGSYSWHLGS
jgi:3-oxoacyl-ACP reductase-like protein